MGQKSTTVSGFTNEGLKTKMSTSSKDASSTNIRQNICQNFRLFWLDASIDSSNEDFRNSFDHLHRIVNSINTYFDIDVCIKSLSEIKNEKVFMIVSGALGRNILHQIHDMSQLDSVFVFCSNKPFHEQWALKWKKVKGVFTDIISICNELYSAVRQCDQNSVPVSFLSISLETNATLTELDHSFTCIQLLKKNIIQNRSDSKVIEDFVTYCNARQIDKSEIEEFEKDYRASDAIKWYTSDCFLAPTLNWALHTLEVNTILKMSFFIHDLHKNIQEIYNKQRDKYNKYFTVYRGQGLSNADFEKLKQNKNNLISFNNFLITSKNKKDCRNFARNTIVDTNTVGVIFVMTIDNSKLSTNPFAQNPRSEQEILFSLHTVFHIDNIIQLEENEKFWKVELTLKNENDEQLVAATKLIQNQIWEVTGWDQLTGLLAKLGEFDKAKEIYNVLLDWESSDNKKAHLYQQLGRIQRQEGDYDSAIKSFQSVIQIYENPASQNYANLADCYNNIGLVYENIGDFENALSSHEKALEIRKKTIPSDPLILATSYNNIGNVYNEMHKYVEALSFHQKSLAIRESTLPPNHPNLANSYNNLGLVYFNQKDYLKALENHEKAFEIRQKVYPINYHSLAGSYNNIGLVHENMGDYSKARTNYENAITAAEHSLSSNHPHLLMYKRNYIRVKDIL